MKKCFFALYPLLFCAVAGLLLAAVAAGAEPFPVYPAMAPNVAFWKKVYTRYTSSQGILHDSRNLAIIYTVVALAGRDSRNARKINTRRIKAAKAHYRRILGRLAGGQLPRSAEEKRVAALFGGHADRRTFARARNNIRCQIGQQDRFRQGMIRSGAYLNQIKRIFRSQGLPQDLAYLPHVESSFNPQAYSKFGASGIWQFTRGTGRLFLKINYTVDERRDPLRASQAAARLLKQNYQALGSWPLAITAYNHGLAGMQRAKRRHGGYEAVFRRYRSRLFKFASRNFYPEFIAARYVARNYRRYFGDLKLRRPEKSVSVKLAGYTPLADLIRRLHVDPGELRRLNPALRQPIYSGQKYIPRGFLLHLPPAAGKKLSAHPAHLLAGVYRPHQKRSRFYMVRSGDTLGAIARMHGLRLAALMQANDLNGRAIIRPGQNLRLPLPGEKPAGAAKTVPPQPAKAVLLAAKSRPAPPAGKRPTPALPPAQTAFKEAAASPAPAAAAVAINPAVVSGNLTVESVRITNGRRIGYIRVQAAETLGHYADWLGVATRRIRRLNHFAFSRAIRLNERIKIPLEHVSKAVFEEKRYEYHKEIAEDFLAAYRIEQTRSYAIKRGDNIWKLCREVFDVPFWLVTKYNPDLDFRRLNPSQTLIVPVVAQIG